MGLLYKFISKVIDLLKVKSIITMACTFIFCYLSAKMKISTTEFMTVFTVIIGFYFGTQAEKRNEG